jgi:hypothetical protein
MPTVQPLAPDLAKRRMVAGLLRSLLVHALVLSIRFGLPGMQAGTDGRISVSLAPLPAPSLPAELPALQPAPASSAVAAPLPAPWSALPCAATAASKR